MLGVGLLWMLALALSGTVQLAAADVFTSINDMHLLLHTEEEVIRTMENYIATQEARLIRLRRDLAEMGALHKKASQSPDQFLGHPINAFLLVKRLTLDWADLQTTLTQDIAGQEIIANLTSMDGILRWPDEEDLSGVASALMRLQDTYQLDTTRMAQGYINDMPPAYKGLSVSDCFELGRQSYNTGDHYHTVLWMSEALERLESDGAAGDDSSTNSKGVTRADILEYLAFSNYMQGHVKHALKLTNELLQLRPNHHRAHGNKIYYEEALRNIGDGRRGEDGRTLQDEAVQKGYTVAEEGYTEPESAAWQRERDNYERLCRGDVRVNPRKIARLSCHYQYGPHPSLRIAPVRAEVAHINPTITVYHNVMYEEEIAIIKTLAVPRFKRATVQNYKTGALETASYRISKSAWLKEEDHPTVVTVNKRIAAMTGLELSTAEELQVANYGVGGHYEPHYDYARREEKDAFKSLGTGNRIATFLFYEDEIDPSVGVGPFGNRVATWLFYMSDVSGGGATVFPLIETALWPSRGSAAFWYNLHPSGEGDALTRHAACPVLLGEKWVSNKWIHERGQEFIRQCDLHPNAL